MAGTHTREDGACGGVSGVGVWRGREGAGAGADCSDSKEGACLEGRNAGAETTMYG